MLGNAWHSLRIIIEYKEIYLATEMSVLYISVISWLFNLCNAEHSKLFNLFNAKQLE